MSILRKPLVSEKASSFNEKGVYGFIVDTNANKIEIKKKVEKDYGVSVVSVNTMLYAGKKKTTRTKRGVRNGQKAMFKKALVTLKQGEVIDFYSDIA